MSFIAHGPEQVYRYVLRLDTHERSLSDRFGFSIVLINDDSDLSTKFLLKYFVKLSHRTAHRVRFVFFAEMTGAETNDYMSPTGELTRHREFKAKIKRGVERSRACAVFVGPEGIGPWQELELDAAFEGAKRGLRMIPVLIGSANLRDLPVILRRFSFVHIADASDRAAIEQLGRGLRPAS